MKTDTQDRIKELWSIYNAYPKGHNQAGKIMGDMRKLAKSLCEDELEDLGSLIEKE